jgi:hypothetical protein
VKKDVVMRQNYDFGPLFGSTVGFDRVFEQVQNATRGEQQGDKYPLYDIERTGEDAWFIRIYGAGRFSVGVWRSVVVVTRRAGRGCARGRSWHDHTSAASGASAG